MDKDTALQLAEFLMLLAVRKQEEYSADKPRAKSHFAIKERGHADGLKTCFESYSSNL